MTTEPVSAFRFWMTVWVTADRSDRTSQCGPQDKRSGNAGRLGCRSLHFCKDWARRATLALGQTYWGEFLSFFILDSWEIDPRQSRNAGRLVLTHMTCSWLLDTGVCTCTHSRDFFSCWPRTRQSHSWRSRKGSSLEIHLIHQGTSSTFSIKVPKTFFCGFSDLSDTFCQRRVPHTNT